MSMSENTFTLVRCLTPFEPVMAESPRCSGRRACAPWLATDQIDLSCNVTNLRSRTDTT